MMWLIALVALAVVLGAAYCRPRQRALSEASQGDPQARRTALLLEVLALTGAVLVIGVGGIAAERWSQSGITG
jgi:hypothetical protein